ncbi:MAG: ParB/RepB/Spo0J family partition protein [Pseudomonadota bacterium]
MNIPEDRRKPARLGRGLSSLIGEVEAVATEPATTGSSAGPSEIAIVDIRPNPAQPRQTFEPVAMEELLESVRAKGVIQPILVRPDPKLPGKFQIVAGERRWRAAKAANLSAIPATVRNVDELELLEVGIIENVQRSDLNPMEEAEAYDALIKRFGRTQEGLAESIGKSRAHISNTMRLLNLPEPVREHVRNGRLTAGHARAVLTAPDPEALANLAVEKKWSVRDVEMRAKSARDGADIRKGVAQLAAQKDVDTQALEADIARNLGLDVDIRHGARGGEIRIKYRQLDQLDDVCRRLTGKGSEL